ncbi:MAG: hypothetical protein KDB35_16815 [Acidimicrobiales bacterium]|nr:hypothetical protein [Acidimicrobiales bacterium]
MNEERADEGLEHLQTAAEELIQAARAFLDVAEEVVTDPKTADSLLGFLDDVAGLARRGRRGAAPADDGDGDDPVEHIPVT